MAKNQELYWSYVWSRDLALKKALQRNFKKPILEFPDFPKELIPIFEENCAKETTDKEESTEDEVKMQ